MRADVSCADCSSCLGLCPLARDLSHQLLFFPEKAVRHSWTHCVESLDQREEIQLIELMYTDVYCAVMHLSASAIPTYAHQMRGGHERSTFRLNCCLASPLAVVSYNHFALDCDWPYELDLKHIYLFLPLREAEVVLKH